MIFAAALALRIPGLDRKPMHGDEANQAVRAGQLMDSGVYHYDPNDHHGPVMYFAAMPFCRATAASFAETTEWNFRLVTVFFSALTMLLMLGLGCRSVGGLFSNRTGMLFALLFTALSPALTYYSRFFIQETMLLCFLTGMLACGYGYVRARTRDSQPAGVQGLVFKPSVMAALFGVFTGLCVATKETTVLSFAAMAAGGVAAFGFKRCLQLWSTRDFIIAVAAALFTAVLFFSSFFTYPQGVYDAVFSTVSAYLHRATAVPEHQHPWFFYFRAIFWFKYGRGPVWSEAGVLLPAAVALAVTLKTLVRGHSGITAHTRFVFFLAVYTIVLTVLYSLIPYKTPWCALSFLHGYILLAGVGAGYLIDLTGGLRSRSLRRCLYPLALALTLWLAVFHIRQTIRACGPLAADPRNPYVYAHTGVDAMELVAAIEKAAARLQGAETLIAVAAPIADTWPLPWYLRRFQSVGYWTRIDQIPAGMRPGIIVAAADQGDAAAERFGQDMQANFFGIRPGVLLNLFVPAEDE